MPLWFGLWLICTSPQVGYVASDAVIRTSEQCLAHLLATLFANSDAILELGHLSLQTLDLNGTSLTHAHKRRLCFKNQSAPRIQPRDNVSTDKVVRHIPSSQTTTRRAFLGAHGEIPSTSVTLQAHVAEAMSRRVGDKLNTMEINKGLRPKISS